MRSLPLFTMLQVSRAEMEEEFDMNVVALISILDKYTLSMKVELFSTGGIFFIAWTSFVLLLFVAWMLFSRIKKEEDVSLEVEDPEEFTRRLYCLPSKKKKNGKSCERLAERPWWNRVEPGPWSGRRCGACNQYYHVDIHHFQTCAVDDVDIGNTVTRVKHCPPTGREIFMHVKVRKNHITVYNVRIKVNLGEFPRLGECPDLPPLSEILSVSYPMAEAPFDGYYHMDDPGKGHSCGQSFNSYKHVAQPQTGCLKCADIATSAERRAYERDVVVKAYTPYHCNKIQRFRSGRSYRFMPDASIPQTIGKAGYQLED
jgi:hypothetical protein